MDIYGLKHVRNVLIILRKTIYSVKFQCTQVSQIYLHNIFLYKPFKCNMDERWHKIKVLFLLHTFQNLIHQIMRLSSVFCKWHH